MIYVIIAFVIIILGLIITLLFMRGAHNQEMDEADEKHIQEMKKEQAEYAKKTEKKESMETGNNRSDFDNSIDLMSELAKRDN